MEKRPVKLPVSAEHSTERMVASVKAITAEIQDLYCLDAIPWVIGYSGGKDSTAVLQLVWNALARLPAERRQKTIHVISTDTLVESPVVSAWVTKSLERIAVAAHAQQLPILPHSLKPELKDRFWVNLIGRGYPAPRFKFRWCTERLKIRPSNHFIRDVIRTNGEAILVLGTRKAESSKRAANMNLHAEKRVRDRLSPNANLPNSLVYTPIEDWSNENVWQYLMQVQNPWGHSNRDLMSMYRGASADNECPLVVDSSTPSCGNSRFGCWVCTMVERDHSMEAMIQNDDEKEWMLPLLEIRNELDAENDRDRRDFRRASGEVQLFNGQPIPGPYTKEWREHWLRRVLTTQRQLRQEGPPEVGQIELIAREELAEIRRIWLFEKHEFDDAVPRIYREVFGEDLADTLDRGELGPIEWDTLREACGNDSLLVELVARLLREEEAYRTWTRRIGVHSAIEEILRTRGFVSAEEAIADAEERAAIRRMGVTPSFTSNQETS